MTGAGLALLSACAPAPTAAPAPNPGQPASAGPTLAPAASPTQVAVAEPATPATQQPKTGGTLTLVTPEPPQFDPHIINIDIWDNIYQLHDTLTEYDRALKPQPRLAESWDLSNDYKQIKLNLRKGVQFHTGRELTSDDVKYNLLRVRDPKRVASQAGVWSAWFQTIETPDKYTIVLTSDTSRPAMFDLFESLTITDPVTMDALDQKTTTQQAMVGTGPFKLAEYVPGVSMSFTKNANYWQSGKPYLDQVKTIFSADPQTAAVQLEAGAVDDITRPSLRDAARLSQDPKYAVRRIEGSGGFFLLVCNATLPPTDEKKFRQTINFAIDRQRLADTILLKQGGGPLNLPWPAHSPAYQANKNQTYTFDLDKARALVAGLPDLTMEIVVTPLTAQINDFAQVLQADLAQIGVTAKINTMERAAATPYTRNLQYKGIQFALGGLSQMSPSTLFVSSYYAYGTGANSHGFHGDRYVQLVDAAGTETDPARQKALYSDLNDVMLDESVQMPMVEFSQVIASRAYVKGVRWRISLPRVWEDIWLDK